MEALIAEPNGLLRFSSWTQSEPYIPGKREI